MNKIICLKKTRVKWGDQKCKKNPNLLQKLNFSIILNAFFINPNLMN